MAARQRLICAAKEVEEDGRGWRFEVELAGETVPAFVIRWQGRVYAYLNRCGHIPVEMDWQPGEFFDPARIYLVCATHGAYYDPVTGSCLSGRCDGRGLTPLAVREEDGQIYYKDEI